MTNTIENSAILTGTIQNTAELGAWDTSFTGCPPPNFWMDDLIPGLLMVLPLLLNLYLVIRGGLARKRQGSAEQFPALLRISSACFLVLALIHSLYSISMFFDDLVLAGAAAFSMLILGVSQMAGLIVWEIPGIALGFIGAMILDLPKKSKGDPN
jgi:hypothetical protein